MSSRWRLASAVITCIALAGACGREQYWQGASGPTVSTVAVVGDSYVGQLDRLDPTDPGSTTTLTDALTHEGWQAHVHGETGWPIGWVQALAEDALAEGADAIVVVAGVNDVAWAEHQADEHRARSQVEDDVNALLDLASTARCVVWPTVAPTDPEAHRANRTVRAINETLRARSSDRLIVPEWGRVLRHRKHWIGPDGLHLSDTGERALQNVLIRAVRSCLGPGTGTFDPDVEPS